MSSKHSIVNQNMLQVKDQLIDPHLVFNLRKFKISIEILI